jgi:hypothetical protein
MTSSHINPAQHKQLFLDDHAIASMSNVNRTLHQPDRYGPILRADRSCEQVYVQSGNAPQWNSEKEIWEWWYDAHYAIPPSETVGTESSRKHYATSTDGVHWETPSLGLYQRQGSKDNNIAYDSKLEFLTRRGVYNPPEITEQHLYHVIRDERDDDPQRRYKGLFSDTRNMGRLPGVSPDGFRWTLLDVLPIPSEDTSNFIYDEISNQYIATVKQRTVWGRSLWVSTSVDFVNWTEPKLALHTDEIDRENRKRRIQEVVENPAYLTPPVLEDTDYIAQLYMMPLMPYEGMYIGFPLLFNPAGPDLPQMNHCGINQVELAVSRDLYHWERVADREVFIGVEPWDGINYGTTQVAVCSRPIVHDNREIRIYHNAHRFRGHQSIYSEDYAEYFNDAGALHLARLRLDGFVSLDAEAEGEVVTERFTLNGADLYVNADVPHGELRAEILDAETMHPLPGLSESECLPLNGDHLRGKLVWKDSPRLVSEKAVRVRFILRQAKLYAFWLE